MKYNHLQFQFIKPNDKVGWRGSWGREQPEMAKVTKIEMCDEEGDKHGIEVPYTNLLDKDRCVFELDNGHWAYGYQINYIPKDSNENDDNN